MKVLPINHIDQEDKELVGSEFVLLSKIARNDIPVANCIVVTPPTVMPSQIFQHGQLSVPLLEHLFQNMLAPKELEELLLARRIVPGKVWSDVKKSWVEELKAKVFREGVMHSKINLTPAPIFFTGRILVSGEAFLSNKDKKLTIDVRVGNLDKEQITQLEEYITKAQKIAVLPFIYQWVVEDESTDKLKVGKLKILRLIPYTQEIIPDEREEKVEDVERVETLMPLKTSVKVFLQLENENHLAFEQNLPDGFIIQAEKIKDVDDKVRVIWNAASENAKHPVIFRFSDLRVNGEDIRGVEGLQLHPKVLAEDAKAFLYVRHSKALLNVSLGVPAVRNVEEFNQFKQNLASLGIYRKGTLKYYVEFQFIENFLYLEEYLESGLDGVIINVDELNAWVLGYDQSNHGSIRFNNNTAALQKFLLPFLKILHRRNIPFIASAKHFSDELINFFVEYGAWGLVLHHSDLQGFKSEIARGEHRLLKKRLLASQT